MIFKQCEIWYLNSGIFAKKKKNECFFSLVFCLCFMIYVLFSFLFCYYKVSVTMSLMISWTKNLYFLAGVFWLFFCNFQGQKMLAVAKEAESGIFSSHRWKGQSSSFQKSSRRSLFRPRLLGKTERRVKFCASHVCALKGSFLSFGPLLDVSATPRKPWIYFTLGQNS